ncbi:MAG: hypothetical protein ABIQ56_05770 [Chitinophagaceae bacterium]
MKKILIGFACLMLFSGCSIFRSKTKYGCPSDGKNVGAEKLMSGDPAALKAAKKAKKFKS